MGNINNLEIDAAGEKHRILQVKKAVHNSEFTRWSSIFLHVLVFTIKDVPRSFISLSILCR